MIEYVVVAAILGLLFWQLVLPNIRSGKQPQAGAAPAASPGSFERLMGHAKKYVWPVLLVVAAIAIAVLGGLFEASPSTWTFEIVRKYVWGHGPGLLGLAIVAAVAIAIYGEAEKTKLLQTLGWGMLTLFVGSLVLSWFEPNSNRSVDAPVPGVSRAVQGERQFKILLPPGGNSEQIRVDRGMRVLADGEDFHYHCVYEDEHVESFAFAGEPPCRDGAISFVYLSSDRMYNMNPITVRVVRK